VYLVACSSNSHGTLFTNIFAELIKGTNDDDQILAFGGLDEISGEGRDDKILTGPGNDEVDGEVGDDEIRGEVITNLW
jgi:Ca2+-binding RTX toxin-like protein